MATRRIGNINVNYTVPESQTQMYNALGRNASQAFADNTGQSGSLIGNALTGFGDNIKKRWDSGLNTIGTTLAAPVSIVKDKSENISTDIMRMENKDRMNQIARKYGYNSYHDIWDAEDRARENGDTKTLDYIENVINPELQSQANENANIATNKANAYEDWRKNNFVSQKINQDRGKFAGDAMRTWSTGLDVAAMTTGLPMGVVANAAQGGLEGFADYLSANGGLKSENPLDWFNPEKTDINWGEAGKNIAVGTLSGAATAGLTKGLNNRMLKNGGGVLKQGGIVKTGLNKALNSGVGRGMLSGAVGGAVGAGANSALSGQDIGTGIQNTLQGAAQGAVSGGVTGGIMSAANKVGTKAINAIDNKFDTNIGGISKLGEKWTNSGKDFNERLTNTLNSGESGLGNWLNGAKRSKLLSKAGDLGLSIRDYTNKGMGPRKAEQEAYKDLIKDSYDERGIEGAIEDAHAAGLDNDSNFRKAQKLVEGGSLGVSINDAYEGLKSIYGDDFKESTYLNKDGSWKYKDGEPYVWTIYKNKLAMALSKEMDAAQNANIQNNKQDTKNALSKINDARKNAIRSGVNADEATRLAYKQLQDEGIDTDALSTKEWGKTLSKEIKGVVDTDTMNRLNELRQAIHDENISYGELAELQGYAPEIMKLGDVELAEWAGIPEEDFHAYQNNQNTKAQLDAQKLNNAQKIYDKIDADLSRKATKLYGVSATDEDVLGNMRLQGYGDEADLIRASRQQTPTTAKGWLKQAGKRIIEDMNDKGAGLSIKKVDDGYSDDIRNMQINDNNAIANTNEDAFAQEAEMPRAIQPQTRQLDAWDRLAQSAGYPTYDDAIQSYMAANPGAKVDAGAVTSWLDNNPGDWNINQGRNPQTEMYNTLTNKNGISNLEESFDPDMSKSVRPRNKLQSLGEQLQKSAQTQKYGALFDALDENVAARAIETDAPTRLSEIGIEPENYGEFAKSSDYVNGVLDKLAKDSKVKVNAPELPTMLRADNLDVSMSDDAVKTYNKYINQIVPDGASPSEYSAAELLEKSRWLGQKAERITGKDAPDIKAALRAAKKITRDVANQGMSDAGLFGDATDNMIADGLAKLGYSPEVQDYYTNAVNGKSPDATELIRRTSLAEQARDMSNNMGKSRYRRSASTAPMGVGRMVLRESGLEEPVKTVLRNSVSPIAGKATSTVGKIIGGVGNLFAKGGNSAGNNPSTAMWDTLNMNNTMNIIGRNEGLSNTDQAKAAQYITQATQEPSAESGYMPPLGASTAEGGNTLESLAATGETPSSTAVYDSFYGQQSAPQQIGYFQATGDYWTDILARATSAAIDADDATAFATLYNMYQSALSNLESQTEASSEPVKLTDKQRQANAAAQALDDFEQMDSNLAYDLSDIPVVGDIANFGGNDYKSRAEALALQIGYMLSGATVNPKEAQKIGEAYVPQPRDSQSVRQNKLAQIRGIISNYQQTYEE